MQPQEWSALQSNPDDDWLYEMKNDKLKQAIFLESHSIVNPPICTNCNVQCTLYSLTTNRELERNQFPFRWKCTNSSCTESEDYTYFHNSFLKACKITPFKHIQLIYKFYGKRSAVQAAAETKINVHTVRKWFDFYRRCIHRFMHNHFYPRFQFDTDFAVEWDEAAMSAKQMHNRGRRREPIWVLGGVQRLKNYVVLKVVPNRVRATLHPIIQSVCPNGSTVITDGWRAYLGLSSLGIYHWTVPHSVAFRHQVTWEHTNTIECLWALIRSDLRLLKGIRSHDLQKHLDVFAFRRNMDKDPDASSVWTSMCVCLGAMQDSVVRPSF